MVIKRKKAPPNKAVATSKKGLPKLNAKKRAEAVASNKAAPNLNDEAPQGEQEEEYDPLDQILSSLPNDCALGIQSLQQNNDTSLAIPIPHDPSHVIRGVLELHLHRKMQNDNQGDTIVSRELAELLATNQIRKLSSPLSERHAVNVLVFTKDYERAARNTIHDKNSQRATDWMMRQLPYLTGHRIAQADWQEQWRADPISGTSLEAVLDVLVRQQLLLLSPLEQSYQLWLPTWGVLVLQAWETARKKALMNLKRSAYKERSLSAMQQKYSPIPTVLLLDWMESVGQVEWIDRPAGKFVRLPSSNEDG